MKIGIGTDIVAVKKFRDMKKRVRLQKKLFSEKEIGYACAKVNSEETFAGNFAAKEAIMKAFSSFGIILNFTDIEILHKKNGQPWAAIKNQNSYEVAVSIAHEKKYATASAFVIKRVHE